MTDIPQYKDFTKVELIDKGWSSDKKYYIETKTGDKLLLRVSDISEYDKKKAEFDAVKMISKQGIPMPMPLDFGTCDNGKSIYSLMTWVDGKDAETVVPALKETEQYNLGVKAGQILSKMHSIPAPKGLPSWEQRILNKVKIKHAEYQSCGVKVLHDTEIMQFISDNLWCLKDVKRTFCHGDCKRQTIW